MSGSFGRAGAIAPSDSATLAPVEPPFQDRETDEWYRPEREGAPTVVTDRTDKSAIHAIGRDATACWACMSHEPHSRDFHEATTRHMYERWTSRREDDLTGRVTFVAMDAPFYEGDDDA